MRILLLFLALLAVCSGFSQPAKKILLSGIVLNPDSVPIPDVAIINARTGKTVRTNTAGFFQAEMAEGDSLMAYHIAFKKRFIRETDNIQFLVLEPEIQELLQIDITDHEQEKKNLEQTVDDIKRLAPLEELSGYDLKSRQTQFIEDHGSHNKGFSPFFGPTVHVPFGKIGEIVSNLTKRHQLKKLSSHYHLVKTKKK
ncbi:MAG: hypothetical protein JZU47_19335 [Prolixibacteraceae bacterium]|nr:hypothetical protein [Prolixibacteraceae bacterium]